MNDVSPSRTSVLVVELTVTILKVLGLSKNFGGLAALKDVDMKVEKGEIRGLIGPNGAGKTTFFNVVSGVLKPSSGRVILKDTDITGRKPNEIAAKGLVRTFQLTTLLMNETVEHNVSVGFHLHAGVGLLEAIFNAPSYRRKEETVRSKTHELLEFMGLAQLKNELAKNLPHGHQRAVGVAIALATAPELMLLDEPLTGMNAEETRAMVGLIRRIRDEKGITVVVVEHNMKAVMGLCDRISVLNHGQKIAQGTPKEIVRNPDVIQAYLGLEAHAA